MNYYKAKEQDALPYLTFEKVAGSLEELEAIGLDNDPLVVADTLLIDDNDPDYISYEYGICHKRVVDGELADRLSQDITDAQDLYTAAVNVVKTKAVGEKLANRTFSYAGNAYPLNETALAVYNAIIKKGADGRLMSTSGSVLISSGDLSAFETAMNNSIITINNELIPAP